MQQLKLSFTTITTLVIITFSVFISQNSIAQTSGLVAYYPFNNNANDESGNGNDGTNNSATLTTDRFGNTNSAYSFDGTGNNITFGNGASLQISDDITVCTWVKLNTTTHGQVIVNKYSGSSIGDAGWLIETYPNGTALFNVRTPTTALTSSGGTISLFDSSWHFVVGQREGTSLRIYVDGIFNSSATGPSGTIANSTNLTAGVQSNLPNDPSAFCNGRIDDIRIYNRALTENEIDSLYHLNGWGTPITVSVADTTANLNDTILVPVNVTFPINSSYSSAEINFKDFQSGLQFLAIDTVGSLLGGKNWQVVINNTDTSLITVSAGSDNISGSGTLFNLKFKVIGNVCSFVPINISKVLFNTGSDAVTRTNGGVDIKPIPVYGDVDGNGTVQAFDASKVMKHIVHVDTLQCQALVNADATGNGSVTSADATVILKYVAHIINSLPNSDSLVGTATPNMVNVNALFGDTIFVSLFVRNVYNILGFESEFTYNPSHLQFLDIIGDVPFAMLEKKEDTVNGKILFAGADSNPLMQGGSFVRVKFKVIGNAGTTTNVTLSKIRWNEGELMNNAATSVIHIGTVNVSANTSVIPSDFSLAQNYPNPFNPTTTISFGLPKSGYVSLKIYNVAGVEVSTLVREYLEAGTYNAEWNASNVSSGVYFYQLNVEQNGISSYTATKKLLLMK
jgi:hypothetical protein